MMLAQCIEFAALPLRSAERLCLSGGRLRLDYRGWNGNRN